jgi:uncharacterized protein
MGHETTQADEKLAALRARIAGSGRMAIAFSGGVDSTFLLQVAHEALGDGAIAITARMPALPEHELGQARRFCEERGIHQVLVDVDLLSIPGFRENPPDRCYICKRGIFNQLLQVARAEGCPIVADGSNADDAADYRPGTRALREMDVASPLQEAGLTKAEIRALSREMGLPTWDKPSAACLASRFAYGEEISREGLARVETAEDFLHECGFKQVRVRVHGDIARIEVAPPLIAQLAGDPLRTRVARTLQDLGFRYITIDATGYRTGSMNEQLPAVGAKAEES